MYDQPLRFSIPIVKIKIRVIRDITGGKDWATLVLTDDKGSEHTIGYTDSEDTDHRVYVESPKNGKLKSNLNFKE
jgi:hypothetical protein